MHTGGYRSSTDEIPNRSPLTYVARSDDRRREIAELPGRISPSHLPPTINSLTSGCGALTFGYDGAFIGTTIARPSFKEAMGIDKMTKAEQTAMTTNLTSTFTGSAWFGAVFAWPCMEMFGRKRPMQVSAVLFNIGAILMTVTTHNLALIYAGRAITGFAVGILTATIPTFIAEFSPPAIRGQLTGYFEIAYQLGSLCGFWSKSSPWRYVLTGQSTTVSPGQWTSLPTRRGGLPWPCS